MVSVRVIQLMRICNSTKSDKAVSMRFVSHGSSLPHKSTVLGKIRQ